VYAWQETIVDNAGNVLGNAFVSVRDAFTLELATIHGDRDGIEVLANPFKTRGGFAQFWADAGRYQITAIQGTDERVWEDVRLGFQLGDIPDLEPLLTPIVTAIVAPLLQAAEDAAEAMPDLASFHVLGTGAAGGDIPEGWTAARLGTGLYRVSFPAGYDSYNVKLTVWDTSGDRVFSAALTAKVASSFTYQVRSIEDEASSTDQRVEVEVTYDAEGGQLARFIAIASDTAVDNIMISDDGVEWTLVANPVSAGIFQNLAYSPTLNRVVSVPNGGSTTPIYSDDLGATWVAGTASAGIDADDVVWGAGASAFVCNTTGGSSGAHRSTDGINWGAAINTVYSASPSALAYASDLGNFYMGFAGIGNIVRSPTGSAWVSHTTSADAMEFRSFIRVVEHGLFVYVDSSGNIETSADGVTWTTRQATTGSTSAGVAYSPELDVAVVVVNSGQIWRSGVGDLTTWGLQASSQGTLQSVCWSAVAGLFVAVRSTGTGQRVLTSPDGITWTVRNTPADLVWTRVIAIDPA
jgi:hypothetical protein